MESPPKDTASWQALIFFFCGMYKFKVKWDSWTIDDGLGIDLSVSPVSYSWIVIDLFSKLMLNKYLQIPPGPISLHCSNIRPLSINYERRDMKT